MVLVEVESTLYPYCLTLWAGVTMLELQQYFAEEQRRLKEHEKNLDLSTVRELTDQEGAELLGKLSDLELRNIAALLLAAKFGIKWKLPVLHLRTYAKPASLSPEAVAQAAAVWPSLQFKEEGGTAL